ncbi:MAG: patatin-like phospholipase family protein [Steroidobacteraceae bacterium]
MSPQTGPDGRSSLSPDPAGRSARPRLALLLPGGGARSAYQVGVLKAIASWLPAGTPLPFAILCGTSAGGILAAVLAAYASRFRMGASALERTWRSLHVDQVFDSGHRAMLTSGAQVLGSLLSGGWLVPSPRSVLDTAPLRHLLEWRVNLARIQQSLDRGWLDALVLNATSYGNGESVSFVQSARPFTAWERTGRRGLAGDIGLDHLMASAAIPFLFPPVRVEGAWFGDGAMRQVAPLSPAIHLGAERILVIGVRERGRAPGSVPGGGAPTFGQVAGFMLDTLFMESLDADLERLARINRLVGRGNPQAGGLRRVEALVLQPRGDLSAEAESHTADLPGSVRALFRVLGAGAGAGAFKSVLLFEGRYASRLMALGMADAEARREEILAFIDPRSDVSGQEQGPQSQ